MDGDVADPAIDDRLAEMLARIRQLEEALATRDVIGQATGIVMVREQVHAEAAFDILKRASQRSNRKLHEIARGVVDSVPVRCGGSDT